MVNFRVIARVLSLALIIEGFFMLVSSGVSFLFREQDSVRILFSALITLVSGILVFTPLRPDEKVYENKEGFIIITTIWILLSLFGTLPYFLTGSIKNFGDAFFESISGFTTTGATILTDIEAHSRGILIWRSLTQWIGGIGFILISLSLLPVDKSVKVQLTISDFTGQAADKINPLVKEASKRLISLYILLTLAECFLLMVAGMPPFDAVCHSLSTLSTGGFSTRNNGVASFNSPYILIILIIFMFLAGTNMTLIYFGFKRNFKKIFRSNEFLFYSILCILSFIVLSVALSLTGIFPPGKAILEGAFHVVSVITTTGYYNSDWNFWGYVPILLIFILMFTGGMSGSSSGGLKIIRLLLATKNARHEMRKMIHPNAVIPVRLDRETIPMSHIYNLIVFITLFFVIICLSSLVISMMGYDIISSFSTSAAMLGNIGPALGTFGPFTDFSGLPMAGKWFFSFLMLLGRIELFAVLILFSPGFYKH